MIILVPFSLLYLRNKIQRKRTSITINDAYKLKRLTHKLYEHIYARYPELREVTEMTDESLILDIDILEDKYEKLFAEKDAIMAEKDAALVEKDNIIAKLIAENEALRMAMK